MSTAVIGAGLTGLAAAHELAAAGRPVTVFERAAALGGLASGFDVGGETLERYYHHVFTHDTTFLAYVEALGLADRLRWLPSRMAMFDGGALHPFSSPFDLLRYRPLGLLARLRFGLATLAARRVVDHGPLEAETARAWLVRLFGREGYRAVWEPMLRLKFGPHAEEVAAVWIWSRLAVRAASRKAGSNEVLGYLDGSFQVFHDALGAACRDRGVDLRLGAEVRGLARRADGWHVEADGTAVGPFAQVLVAAPMPAMRRLAEPFLAEDERDRLAAATYQGALVAVLALDRPLTSYYWINVNDAGAPFGAIIEHTNLVPAARYGGRHVVYLGRYLAPSDPFFAAPADEVLARFLGHLPAVNPAFDPAWVQGSWVFRDAYAQPVIRPHHRTRLPPLATSAEGLFLANMSHVYPEDRGMNHALRLGGQAAEAMRRGIAGHGLG